MLLNEPTPHQTRPAAATAAAAGSTRELPPVEVDGAPTPARANGAQADTIAFSAVDAGSANGSSAGSAHRSGASSANGSGGASPDSEVSAAAEDGESPRTSSAQAPTVGIVTVGGGADVLSTVALDVDAVKRALAEGRAAADATDTVSLDVEGVKQALAEEAGAIAGGDALAETTQLATGSIADADISADSAPAEIDADADAEPDTAEPVVEDSQDSEASSAESPNGAGPAADFEDSHSESSNGNGPAADASADTSTGTSTDTVLAADSSTDLVPTPGAEPDHPAGSYLASTNLSTSASTLVAVPETADDVIATIHAAATVVAEADRRARRAAVAKADPWTGLDLHQPATPEPVDDVLDLLSPVLERPLLVVEQPGPPAAADVVALHRSELEVDFVEPPVVAAGAEPPIPPRYGPGLSVLPHIDFPV
jgi:hypothetical protein